MIGMAELNFARAAHIERNRQNGEGSELLENQATGMLRSDGMLFIPLESNLGPGDTLRVDLSDLLRAVVETGSLLGRCIGRQTSDLSVVIDDEGNEPVARVMQPVGVDVEMTFHPAPSK